MKKFCLYLLFWCLAVSLASCSDPEGVPSGSEEEELLSYVEAGRFYTPEWYEGYLGTDTQASVRVFLGAAADSLRLNDGGTIVYKPVWKLEDHYPDARLEQWSGVDAQPSYVYGNTVFYVRETIENKGTIDAYSRYGIESYNIDSQTATVYPFDSSMYRDTPEKRPFFVVLYANEQEIYYLLADAAHPDQGRELYCYDILNNTHTFIYDFPEENPVEISWTVLSNSAPEIDGKVYFNEYRSETEAAILELDLGNRQVRDTGLVGYQPYNNGTELCWRDVTEDGYIFRTRSGAKLYELAKGCRFGLDSGYGDLLPVNWFLPEDAYNLIARDCPNMEEMKTVDGTAEEWEPNAPVATVASAVGIYSGETFRPLISSVYGSYANQPLDTDGTFAVLGVTDSNKRTALLVYDSRADKLVELTAFDSGQAATALTEDYIVVCHESGIFYVAKDQMQEYTE